MNLSSTLKHECNIQTNSTVTTSANISIHSVNAIAAIFARFFSTIINVFNEKEMKKIQSLKDKARV